MEQKILELLIQLNSPSLKDYPVFINDQTSVKFTVGIAEGPKVEWVINDSKTILLVRDENGDIYRCIISNGTEFYLLCESILNKIIILCDDGDYLKLRDSKWPVMVTNVMELIKPVIALSKMV